MDRLLLALFLLSLLGFSALTLMDQSGEKMFGQEDAEVKAQNGDGEFITELGKRRFYTYPKP